MVKSKEGILQNYVAFTEFMNFNKQEVNKTEEYFSSLGCARNKWHILKLYDNLKYAWQLPDDCLTSASRLLAVQPLVVSRPDYGRSDSKATAVST